MKRAARRAARKTTWWGNLRAAAMGDPRAEATVEWDRLRVTINRLPAERQGEAWRAVTTALVDLHDRYNGTP